MYYFKYYIIKYLYLFKYCILQNCVKCRIFSAYLVVYTQDIILFYFNNFTQYTYINN